MKFATRVKTQLEVESKSKINGPTDFSFQLETKESVDQVEKVTREIDRLIDW